MKAKHLVAALALSSMAISLSAQTWTALPTDDTFSQAQGNTTPNGSVDYLYLKNSTGGEWRRDVYMRFDLTACDLSFPAASVKVYLFTMPGDLSPTNPGFFCYKLNGYENSNWTEDALVSANRPTGFNFADRLSSPDCIAYWDFTDYIDEADVRYYALDITAYANAQKAAGSNEINFIIRGMGNGSEEMTIKSKEAPESQRPYIEVTAGSSGITGTQADNIQVSVTEGYLSLLNMEGDASVELYAINGICQLEADYTAPLYVGGLSGVYLLKVWHNGSVVTKKVIL